jgi:hypothetical protein
MAATTYCDLPLHVREMIYDHLDIKTRFKTYCSVKDDQDYMARYIEDCGLPTLFNIESKLLNTNNLISIEVKIPQLCIYWSAFYIEKGDQIVKNPYYKTTKDLAKQLVNINKQRQQPSRFRLPRTLDMVVYSSQGNTSSLLDFNDRWERMIIMNFSWDFVNGTSTTNFLHDNWMTASSSSTYPTNPVTEDMLIQMCHEIIQSLSQ